MAPLVSGKVNLLGGKCHCTLAQCRAQEQKHRLTQKDVVWILPLSLTECCYLEQVSAYSLLIAEYHLLRQGCCKKPMSCVCKERGVIPENFKCLPKDI